MRRVWGFLRQGGWAALLAILLGFPAGGASSAGETPVLPRGHVFLETGFEGADALQGWQGEGCCVAGYEGGQSLMVERATGGASGGAMLQKAIPVEAMRGYTVYGSAMVKAEGVTAKPRPWNGVKFMVCVDTPGGKLWPNATTETGTFDWRRATFVARIPPDATAVMLFLGLEAVTGKAWFDDVKLYVGKPPPAAKPRPVVTTGLARDVPRLRGAMISPDINEAGLRTLGKEWNANVLRWQLIRYVGQGKPTPPPAEYDAWLEGELKRLDAALPLCEQYGLHVVVDLHSPPGGSAKRTGYLGSDDRLFTEKASQDKFVAVWEKMARRYKGARPVWGYDLANEPVEEAVGDDCLDWRDLAERAAKAIRAIDPDRAVIVEPADWGGPAGLRDFAPLDVPNVVYSVHMYIPSQFTHQGVFAPSKPVPYPGEIEGRMWDRARLEAALKPVVDFQKACGARIYIGEFSAIRWAPDAGAQRYLKDVIDIFEANGWDWTYHAFREWQGWSVEHGTGKDDTKPAAAPTDRQKLLTNWFAKNRKPAWMSGP